MDLSSIPLSGILATGGVAALVTASWQHLKGFGAYLSKFLIGTLTVEGSSSALAQYIARNGVFLKSGSWSVKHNIYIGEEGAHFHHWLKEQSLPAIIRVDGNYLLVKHVDPLELSFIRPITNLDALLAKVAEEMNDFNRRTHEEAMSQGYGFSVIEVTGRDRTLSTSRPTNKGSDSDSPSITGGYSDHFQFSKHTSAIVGFLPTPSNTSKTLGSSYSEDIKQKVGSIKEWLNLRHWYMSRSIPWRKGWLLYGPPGSGKSTLVREIAKLYDLTIFKFNLSTLTDQEFLNDWQNVAGPAIALFEDFDNIFKGRENITPDPSLSFDCVLNAISGVKQNPGIFLVITTNNIDAIDPALGGVSDSNGVSSRPGRIDTSIYLGAAEQNVKQEICERVLRDWPELQEKALLLSEGYTVAQVESLCVSLAETEIQLNGLPKVS